MLRRSSNRLLAMALAVAAFALTAAVAVTPDDALANHFAPSTNFSVSTSLFPPTLTGTYEAADTSNSYGFEVSISFQRGPAAVAPGPVTEVWFRGATINVEHVAWFAFNRIDGAGTVAYKDPGVRTDLKHRSDRR